MGHSQEIYQVPFIKSLEQNLKQFKINGALLNPSFVWLLCKGRRSHSIYKDTGQVRVGKQSMHFKRMPELFREFMKISFGLTITFQHRQCLPALYIFC